MGRPKLKDKLYFTPVRFSHLTSHAAVGAVVRDQNDWLMWVKDISTWPESNMQQLHAVERVKYHLSVSNRLLLPPTSDIDDEVNFKINGGTIPTERFPSWAECQSCHSLYFKPWLRNTLNINEKASCSNPDCSSGDLEQVTWCAVSSFGGLTDIPWHFLCHRGKSVQCRVEKDFGYLKICQNGRGGREIECIKCGSKGSFERADFQSNSHYQPGIKLSTLACEHPITYTVMEVNDPRVYNAINERALVIPPESNIDRNSLVYRLQQHSQVVSDIKNATGDLRKRREIKKALRIFRCSQADLLAALETVDREREHIHDQILFGDMESDEYEALTTPQEFNSDADFITRHLTEDWRRYINDTLTTSDLRFAANLVSCLVAVDRLRVIEVFKGFERSASDYETIDPKVTQSPDFSGQLDWLPAIELFGEGVFFSLDCEKLEEWESNSNIRRRAQEIEKRYDESTVSLPEGVAPTPRFIMLHTLAHILIREFESSAGYPAASLQERIYSSTTGGMAGILIYTAVPDIAGSLGGIVELANPDKFIRLLDAAMRQAEWCSLDPVCGEMEGQGPAWLNRAACHGCALVPDTSCSYNNVFLDRVFIKGHPDEGICSVIDVMR